MQSKKKKKNIKINTENNFEKLKYQQLKKKTDKIIQFFENGDTSGIN